MKNLLNHNPHIELHGRALNNLFYIKDYDLKNKIVLDVGCGYGWFALNALTRDVKNITGIEINEADINTCKKYLVDSRANFKIGSAIEIPGENNFFDTVVSWDVIEHIPLNTENKMFSEVNRVLKTDGIFYLSTPYDNFFAKIFDPAWWLIGHRHYSLNLLRAYGKANGFELIDYEIGGRMWEIINVNNRLISKWVFRREPFYEELVNKKRDKEYASINGLTNKEMGFTNIFVKFKKIS